MERYIARSIPFPRNELKRHIFYLGKKNEKKKLSDEWSDDEYWLWVFFPSIFVSDDGLKQMTPTLPTVNIRESHLECKLAV